MKLKFSEQTKDSKLRRIEDAYAYLFTNIGDPDAEYVVNEVFKIIFDGGEELEWLWQTIFEHKSEARQKELDKERTEKATKELLGAMFGDSLETLEALQVYAKEDK